MLLFLKNLTQNFELSKIGTVVWRHSGSKVNLYGFFQNVFAKCLKLCYFVINFYENAHEGPAFEAKS